MYQERVVTVQVGRGQPSGGDIEDRAVGRKAERALRKTGDLTMADLSMRGFRDD